MHARRTRRRRAPGGAGTLLGAALACALLLPSSVPAETKPRRIVSLNLCTDQILLMLVAPARIAAVSHLARDPSASVMAEEAAGLRATAGLAEEILTLRADLVIAGSYTTRPTVRLLKMLGQRVVEVAPAASLDDIRENVRRIAGAVGEAARGEALISAFDDGLRRLAAVGPPGDRPVAAAYYASNYTSGAATLADAVLRAAGFRNLAAEMGRHGMTRLSLEHLVAAGPDLIVLGHTRAAYATITSENLRHPALRRLLRSVPSVSVPDRLWVCGTPHTLDAVERLARARERLARSGSGR